MDFYFVKLNPFFLYRSFHDKSFWRVSEPRVGSKTLNTYNYSIKFHNLSFYVWEFLLVCFLDSNLSSEIDILLKIRLTRIKYSVLVYWCLDNFWVKAFPPCSTEFLSFTCAPRRLAWLASTTFSITLGKLIIEKSTQRDYRCHLGGLIALPRGHSSSSPNGRGRACPLYVFWFKKKTHLLEKNPYGGFHIYLCLQSNI